MGSETVGDSGAFALGVEDTTQVTNIAETALPGNVILGKYRIDAVLGVGGFGRVVKAYDVDLREAVAIKLLRDDLQLGDEPIERLIREARAAALLESKHVVRVRHVGRLHGGSPYIVMELLDGVDLARLLQARGAIDATLAADLLLPACHALVEAHGKGIVHRDIKPSNLFLANASGGAQTVKVLDFGIAKAPVAAHDAALTSSMSLLGTPSYMSPEQTRSARSVDARSDIWSLGAVLYELVEGKPPFVAESFAEICVLVATEPAPPMRLGASVQHIVDRCLEKNPDDRYQSVAEFATALAAFASSDVAREYTNTGARPIARASSPSELPTSKRVRPASRRWLLGALAVGALAAAGAAVIMWPSDERASVPARGEAPAAADAPPIARPAAPAGVSAPVVIEPTPAPQPPEPSAKPAPPRPRPSPRPRDKVPPPKPVPPKLDTKVEMPAAKPVCDVYRDKDACTGSGAHAP